METLVDDDGVPAAPVTDVEDALTNEQTEAREMVRTIEDPERGEIPVIEHPLNFRRAANGVESPPPRLGEHNRAVLEAAGYDEREIEELAEKGAFGDEERPAAATED